MQIKRNIFLFNLNYLFSDMWPLSALAVVYFEQITGSYAAALGIFSIATVVQSLTEIPTGIVSDTASRKSSMIFSAIIFFLSFVAFACAGTFNAPYLLILGGFLWGIAEALNSGTDVALMYETAQEIGQEENYDTIFAKSRIYNQIGLTIGAFVAAGVTYFYSLKVLAWVSIIPALGQVITSFFFVEPSIRSKDNVGMMMHFINSWKDIINNKKLRTLSIMQMINTGVSAASYRLEGAYFNGLISAWLVNITKIIQQALGALSFAIFPKIKKIGLFKILWISSVGMALVRLVGVIINNVISPFIISCVDLFYGAEETAESSLLQKELSPKQRATMGSIVALNGGLFSALIYYAVGVIADIYSIYIAFILLIVLKAMIGFGYNQMLRRYSK